MPPREKGGTNPAATALPIPAELCCWGVAHDDAEKSGELALLPLTRADEPGAVEWKENSEGGTVPWLSDPSICCCCSC